MNSLDRICLVHLVRRCNGPDVLKRFVSAYRKNAPGIEHRLLILFKGFEGSRDIAEFREILSGLDYLELEVPDRGYDIGSYVMALRLVDYKHQYYCFLNSFSEPLHPGWLELMYRHVSRPDVGLVGATGSYQSLHSDLSFDTYIYRRHIRNPKPIGVFKRVLLRAALGAIRFYRFSTFPPFPNPHIRTNAFMLPTSVLRQIRFWEIDNKFDAYRFESGKEGLTRQVARLGQKALLVGADGIGYDVEDWFKSNTFRRSEQDNLLVADNQTRIYMDQEMNGKIVYSHHAWGAQGLPSVSQLQRTADERA